MQVAPSLFVTIVAIVASFILVALNGFFVAAEFAIVKVRRTRLEELAGQGVKAARISILCVDQMDEYLSTTQLGITLVSLGLGWIGEHAFANLLIILFPDTFSTSHTSYHLIAAGISFFLITLLHVVLGELVPKSMAIQNADEIAMKIARPLRLFHTLSSPLIKAFTILANFILRLLGYHSLEEEPLSEQELKLVMKESREEGVISESEAQIINRAFEFADKRVKDIMVPLERVDYISLARPLDQNLAVVKRHMHTRFPLCKIDMQNVIGIVHMKDVWPLLLTEFSNTAFEKSARMSLIVDAGVRQDQLLKTFQSRRGHLAIVQDLKRKMNLGIVTMEDILEQIVGEIHDEHGN